MLEELSRWFESAIRNIDGGVGRRIRYWYYRQKFESCGVNVIIESGVYIQSAENVTVGDNVWIDKQSIIIAGPFNARGRKHISKPNTAFTGVPGKMIISNGVHVAPFVVLQGHAGLFIGKNVTIASGAKVYSLSHHYRNLLDPTDLKRYSFSTMAPVEDQFLISSPVYIGDNCAVGINSVVLPGTTIASGTWLGVLSYVPPGVTDPNSIYVTPQANKK